MIESRTRLLHRSGKYLFLVGVFLLMYPFLSNLVQTGKQRDYISAYQDVTDSLTSEEIEKDLYRATEYNKELFQKGFSNGYQELLNRADNGMMGSITIPKIDVQLPVYHGTEESVLESGIGHLSGSSLPVGGQNTHCILAGHRGLPDAELLSRLGEVEIGDRFQIKVYNRTFTYLVCDIRVVRPEETEGLGIQKDRDLVSLITCTPYGINTHRLIVTGERMEEKE